jgi:hypothetical protein
MAFHCTISVIKKLVYIKVLNVTVHQVLISWVYMPCNIGGLNQWSISEPSPTWKPQISYCNKTWLLQQWIHIDHSCSPPPENLDILEYDLICCLPMTGFCWSAKEFRSILQSTAIRLNMGSLTCMLSSVGVTLPPSAFMRTTCRSYSLDYCIPINKLK